MKTIKLDKITLNIGTGEPGKRLENAKKLLKDITGENPIETISNKRIPTWKLRPGLAVACKVTIRGKKAVELLKRLLKAKEDILSERNFDKQGNFSFGIHEYIDIPDAKYDPDIGVIGLEAMITLKRPGFRIKFRKIKKRKVGIKHKISKQEAIEFMKKEFGIKLGDEKE